ncbi:MULTISPECIES: AraC family transcriptional regulator [unclassified Rhodococcus (in: high G+C Gram-positive bacteria)]|uniref:AraC family transcriptional regulator n=1 Tax=unclassified Rhodococcus (in: high G+C Gram-positive bacteria) TaxID=192944 RepID=UPI00163A862C|nr:MULTISPECIES: AraC family transcriptional regulator [unclassified Rhodococcus (in: high G+C Gram-positive bacteria)]MBC2641372.1 AraC family transcriptional regulator [Rhodococcus sp. 3A]MBC2893883.1 AraC family transcriptional regulator [Rhodococcus sp. 4CII]
MDPLAGLISGPRAAGAFVLRSIMEPPWSLQIDDHAPLSLVAMGRGEAWILPHTGEPVRLTEGDVAIVRGPERYVVADHPDTPPHVIINPDQSCTTLRGEPLAEAMDLGVRTWGNSPDGRTVMLTGTYQTPGEISRRLLSALPELVVQRRADWDSRLVTLMHEEVVRDEPGQEAVLDRLLDLLLMAVLRAWFARPAAEAPSWVRAQGDPVVGKAMRILQNNPAHPWTVESLATETGMSRAALARRFTELVGEPPMTFLAGWRLSLAADLLREPDATVASVAQQVGYGSAFALSAAFKRVRGVSPKEHREMAGSR